jgi:hypothetical protein
MKMGMIVAGAALLAPTPALAQAGTEASATRLVQMMKLDSVLDTMFQQMTPVMTGQVLAALAQAPSAPAAVKARLTDAASRAQAEAIMGEEMMKSLRKRYPAIASATVKQYAATFSETDLQAAIAFYQSPAGQRFVAAQPKLQAAMSGQGHVIGMAAGAEAVPAALARIEALPAPAAK